MTLQKITNRALMMYLSEETFKERIETNQDLSISGSNF